MRAVAAAAPVVLAMTWLYQEWHARGRVGPFRDELRSNAFWLATIASGMLILWECTR